MQFILTKSLNVGFFNLVFFCSLTFSREENTSEDLIQTTCCCCCFGVVVVVVVVFDVVVLVFVVTVLDVMLDAFGFLFFSCCC